MISFIENQRVVYGVEPICRVLPIAPSTYYHRLACLANPSKASARHQRDTELCPEINVSGMRITRSMGSVWHSIS